MPRKARERERVGPMLLKLIEKGGRSDNTRVWLLQSHYLVGFYLFWGSHLLWRCVEMSLPELLLANGGMEDSGVFCFPL